MKKPSTLLLSVIAAGIAITSCSKNDNTTTPAASTASIVGTWNAGIMEGTSGGQPIPANQPDQALTDVKCTTPAYYQFNADGTFHYGLYNSSSSCSLSSIDGTYTVDSGNKNFTLKVTVNGTTKQVTNPIVSLTATQLKWEEKGGSGSTATDIIHTMNIKK